MTIWALAILSNSLCAFWFFLLFLRKREKFDLVGTILFVVATTLTYIGGYK